MSADFAAPRARSGSTTRTTSLEAGSVVKLLSFGPGVDACPVSERLSVGRQEAFVGGTLNTIDGWDD